MTQYWRKSEAFDLLVEAIIQENSVFFTGAGISRPLKTEANPAKALPSWKELVEDLMIFYQSSLSGNEIKDIKTILKDKDATGSHIIEAASIIENKVNPGDFKSKIVELTTPKIGTTTSAHRKITELRPRGIVTFNYDEAHENSFNADYSPQKIIPFNADEMLSSLKNRFNKPFLFKAHGCISNKQSIVLSFHDYRGLMHKNPEYMTFMQSLFSNFNLVFYGFGLSDLDFDFFVSEIAAKFGSPIHSHIVIKTKERRNPSKDILLSRRFGIYPLYLRNWSDFPLVIDDALINLNKKSKAIIKHSLSGNMQQRQQAHSYLSKTSATGKLVISNYLKSLKNQYDSYPHNGKKMFEYSELCYTLGILDAGLNKDFLIDVVNGAIHHKPVARALTVLRSVLNLSDMSLIDNWIRQYQTPLSGDRNNRILNYCRHYKVYVKAKFANR